MGDGGLDDRQVFERIGREKAEFVVRASHLDRLLEVHNRRLGRWEREHPGEVAMTVLPSASWEVLFAHAGGRRVAAVRVGWLHLRLPETHQRLWAVAAREYDATEEGAVSTLVLLTNVRVEGEKEAKEIYDDRRLKGRIEHGQSLLSGTGLGRRGHESANPGEDAQAVRPGAFGDAVRL